MRADTLSRAILTLAAAALLVACDGTGESEHPASSGQPLVAPADADPVQTASAELLRQITEAERTQVYSGYKTAAHGADGAGRRTRMRVTRLADGRMVLELEKGGETSRRWVVRHRHRWIDDPTLLLRNYDVTTSEAPVNDVAYRAVQRVEIRSRRSGRPALTLLVDAETHLVLAETLRDHDGVQRFAWQFDTIDFEPAPLDVAEAEIVAAPSRDEADPATFAWDDLDWDVLTPAVVPDGFERVACRTDEDGGLVEYWSDGLAAFALRQKPSYDLAGAREGELERRECSGRASVSGVIEGIEITLLGNIPIDELESVAAGLRLRP